MLGGVVGVVSSNPKVGHKNIFTAFTGIVDLLNFETQRGSFTGIVDLLLLYIF